MLKIGEKIKIVIKSFSAPKIIEGKLLYVPQKDGVDYWIVENEFVNSNGRNREIIGVPNTDNIMFVTQIFTEEIKEDGKPQEEETLESKGTL